MQRHIVALILSVPALAQTPPKTTFESYPTLVVSNDKLEATVLTTGTSIVNLVLKDDPAALSPLWNPQRMARERKKEAGAWKTPGFGHFVCVDGFGPSSREEQAAGMPMHGEAHQQNYEIVRYAKEGNSLTLTLAAKLPVAQENFRRTIRLIDGENVVYVESELESLLGFDRPVNWAEHATMGAPFLEPGQTVVDLPAGPSKTRWYSGGGDLPHRLVSFQEFQWPNAPTIDGKTVDVRGTPNPPNSGDHTTTLVDRGRRLAFITMLHPGKRLLLGYVFNREEYPWVQNWEYYPPDGQLARGLEFGTQPYDVPRRQAIDTHEMFGAPTYRWLPAKGKIGTRFLMFYVHTPDGMTKIDDVRLENGKITVEDRTAAKRLEIPASLGL
jgi:hypothetical protein